MTDDTKDGNVFRFGSIPGGKTDTDTKSTEEIPENRYLITTDNGEEYESTGFLLFTSQHVAVMRDTGAGALPVLVIPLARVMAAELLEDEDVEELPF